MENDSKENLDTEREQVMKRFFTVIKGGFVLLALLILTGNFTTLDAKAGSYTVSVIDQGMKGSITVEHCIADEKTGSQISRVSGVKYQVTYLARLDGTEVKAEDADFFQTEKETDENGIAKFEDLALGTYQVEITGGMPQGYQASEPFQISIPTLNEIEVTYDGVTYEPGTVWEYDIKVLPKSLSNLGAVRLIKYDSRTGESLEGAVFALYYKNGEAYRDSSGDEVRYTTNELGRIEVYHLPYGNYYFQEIQAPEGYQQSDAKHSFSITQSYVEGDDSTIVEVTVANEALEETEPTEPNSEEPKNPNDGSTEPPKDSTSDTNAIPKRGSINPISMIKTGDTTNIAVWVGILLIAVVTLILCLRMKKRHIGKE